MFSRSMPPSRLLTLPAEIRSLIFEYAVTFDKTAVTFRLDTYQQDCYSQAVQPPLTKVSRQVRFESLPIYYECNDFILHSEAPKAEDALKWLRCNHAYLGTLRRLSFWIRYVPLMDRRASSQGAIGVSIYRPKKDDNWTVDGDWRWITVVRKPTELDGDAKFILSKLRDLAPDISKDTAGPEDYAAFMTDVRLFYIQEKMS